MDAIDMESKTASAGPILRRASSPVGLRTLAFVLFIAATSLYLLERLEPVLRPLLIAILLSCLLALTLARACSTTTCGLKKGSQIRSRQVNTCLIGIRANSVPRTDPAAT
ncbi:MAG: hypothetical protein ACXWNF_02540 [Isosphaeraceae bacterium]